MAKVKINTEAIKKNGAAIGCGVVVLAAVVASFYPLGGYKEQLQADVQKSAGAQSALEGVLTKPHPLPVLSADPTAAAEAVNLETFPTEDVITAVEKVVGEARTQSNAMLDAAIRVNRQRLLVPNSLPNPTPAARFAFRDAYQHEFEDTLPKIMNGGTPPPDLEIQKAVEAERVRLEQTMLIRVNNQPVNQQEVQAAQQRAMVEIPKKMREDVAKQKSVYLGTAVQAQQGPNPAMDAFTVVPQVLNPATPPDDLNMWFAQVGVWVQEDVARAIAEVNGKNNVLTAPVKHLLKITLPVPGAYVKDTPPGTASSEDAAAALTVMQAVSPTGRVSNPMYDVIHFTVTMRVVADQLPVVLTALGRNRLITPLELHVTAFDNAAALANGYNYGEQPVVEVAMKCEALQLRRWTVPLMPAVIKTFLGIPLTGAAPAAPAPAAG